VPEPAGCGLIGKGGPRPELRALLRQLKGKVKEQWGKLTNDDLDQIAGKRDQLEGKIQERYGTEIERARQEVDDWINRKP
jgi:uncharacterized protein YjbJ (UPF0337 family)